MDEDMTRTVQLADRELDEFRALIEQRSGIWFDTSRERFFSSHVRGHMEEKGLAAGTDLMRLVRNSNVEYDALLQRLLTHETSFLRYPGVYEALKKHVLPEAHAWKSRPDSSGRTLRIWSAGCSTGEEAYSVAIGVSESRLFSDGWNVEILATDISRAALARASRGVYRQRSLGSLTPRQVADHFTVTGDQYEVKTSIRNMVSFTYTNLAEDLYLGRMDCIFCMNVLMYFSDERRNAVIRRFYNSLEPGGWLLLGHSESLVRVPVKFDKIVCGDCLLYRKPGGEPRVPAAVVSGARP